MLSESWNRGNGTTGLLVSWICSADTLFRSAARTDQCLGKHPGSWLRKQLGPVLGGRLLRMQSSSTLLKSRRERQRLLQLLQSQATAVITPHESHRFILKVRICSPVVLLMACAHTKPFFPSLSPCCFGTAESPLARHLALFILQHCTSQDMNCRTAFCLWWPASSLSFSVLALCLD